MAELTAVGKYISSGIRDPHTGFCGSLLCDYQRHQPDQR